MGIKDLFKGNYKIFITCPNCGFGSEARVPKGLSVTEFVKDGQCKCDDCGVVFYPKEYTTNHFEKIKDRIIKQQTQTRPKPNKEFKHQEEMDKIKDEITNEQGRVKWLS